MKLSLHVQKNSNARTRPAICFNLMEMLEFRGAAKSFLSPSSESQFYPSIQNFKKAFHAMHFKSLLNPLANTWSNLATSLQFFLFIFNPIVLLGSNKPSLYTWLKYPFLETNHMWKKQDCADYSFPTLKKNTNLKKKFVSHSRRDWWGWRWQMSEATRPPEQAPH